MLNPFNADDIEKRTKSITGQVNRADLVESLNAYHKVLDISDQQSNAIEKFTNPDSKVIVTGQQLGLFGGPLYTVFKTITTILLAERIEKQTGVPVVPVFWLADEDHDFEEINSVGIPTYDALIKEHLAGNTSNKPVADIEITDDINELKRNIQALLPETDFTNKLSELLTESYQPGFEHRKAFSKFLLSLFPDSGLIIFGSNFSSIKDLSKSVFRKSVTDADEIQIALSSQSSKLEDGFHSQVVVGSSNLFYINDDGARIKIDRDGTNWIIEGNRKSTDEIVDLVDEHPERFSPNVFLRPVLQDYLLPTIGYVAGPGELAYYGQMKELYPFFGMEMPIIFPRLSATIIESNIERIMDKLPFSLCEYSQRIEDLESAYVDQTNTLDIEGVFASWKENIEDVSDEPAEFVKNIDPTLEGTTAKVITGFENELNKLKGKVYRAVKQQEQTQLDRIAKIQSQIFPDGLQERSVNPVYFMNKYGLDVWQKMLDHYREHQPDYTSHHIYKI